MKSVPVLDVSKRALVLAPHLVFPPRNGADIAIDRIATQLSRHLPGVDVVAAHSIRTFESGVLTSEREYANAPRSQTAAAVRTLLRRSNYLLEKFLTPAFRTRASKQVDGHSYGFILFSYICTASLLDLITADDARVHAIFTHNDQVKWFRNMERAFANPASKAVARQSASWYSSFYARHGEDAIFLYVTEEDRAGHYEYFGHHSSLLVPIGTDIHEHLLPAQYGSRDSVNLLFVGSLGAQMNLDALEHFGECFYPSLRNHLGERLHVHVVGSDPGAGVSALCKTHKWHLRPDVSDDELAYIYSTASYALLPFPYATGAKLKLLGALSHGVPFLATDHVRAQLGSIPAGCVVSNNPLDWVRALDTLQYPDGRLRAELHSLAQGHGWDVIVRNMVGSLSASPDAAQAADAGL